MNGIGKLTFYETVKTITGSPVSMISYRLSITKTEPSVKEAPFAPSPSDSAAGGEVPALAFEGRTRGGVDERGGRLYNSTYPNARLQSLKTYTLDQLREIAGAVFTKAVESVDPYRKLMSMLKIDGNRLRIQTDETSFEEVDLGRFRRIFVTGTGKACSSMTKAVEDALGDRITGGVVTTKYGHALPTAKVEIIETGHPIPDQNGIDGTRRVRALLEAAQADDLVIFLLSGGGSALLPLPEEGITLDDKRRVTQLLLECGADIKEINTIRKHISAVKGGKLARWAYPATVLTFVLSDVVGDPLDAIASGPTVPDTSTFDDAWTILAKYSLLERVPGSIRSQLERGRKGQAPESPKPGDPVFDRVKNFLIGSNILALRAAEKEAAARGFNTLILSSSIVGETREAALFHTALVREVISSGHPISRPACIISGGETTVTIKGNGLGGRNQEFSLAAAIDIDGIEGVVILSGGTDGNDGPTDAAGAFADGKTVARARSKALSAKAFLENNDSYHFFEALGDLLITGPTRTNVIDVRILLVA
jgi:glycerate 2-kinase